MSALSGLFASVKPGRPSCPRLLGSGPAAFLSGRGRRPAVAAMARGGQPIAPTYLRAGSRGAMARRVGCGLGGRLLLEAPGERGGLLP